MIKRLVMKSKLSLVILLLVSILSINAYAQTASTYNKPPESPTKKEIPKGPSLYGVFEGRPPCNAIEKQLGLPVRPECTKVKWRLTFFQDPVTHQPTTYALEGALLPSTGKWIMTKGIPSDPNAMVIELNPDIPGKKFYFFNGEGNVLFVLDEKKEFRVGDSYLSYTLNRVELVNGEYQMINGKWEIVRSNGQ